VALGALLLGAPLACRGEDGGGSGTGASDGGSGGTAGSGGASAGSGGGASAASTAATPDLPPVDVPASGVTIDWVEATQALAIPIAEQGAWVDGGSRVAAIVAGRDTLIRAYWSYGADWVPRQIEARLHLVTATGETSTLVDVAELDIAANPRYLDRSWYFGIPAELAQPGLRFQVELYEVTPELAPGTPPAEPPRSPTSGLELIGFQADPMKMRVVFVPVQAQWAGCDALAPSEASIVDGYRDALFEQNPLAELDLQVRAQPLVITQEPTTLADLFEPLADLRDADAPPPGTYYFALLDACGAPDIDGAGGMAMGFPDPVPTHDYLRLSVGLYLPWDEPWNHTTFVHEIGHLQGMYHVPCDGDPSPPGNWNPMYPDPSGSIQVFGFGVRTYETYDPAKSRDYMTYCYDDAWASLWSWQHTYGVVKELTTWDAPGPPGERPWLLVGLGRKGALPTTWRVTRGTPTGTPAGFARVRARGGGDTQVVVHEAELPDARDATLTTIALPMSPTDVQRVQRRVDGTLHDLPWPPPTR
jgi:hypothetical protein